MSEPISIILVAGWSGFNTISFNQQGGSGGQTASMNVISGFSLPSVTSPSRGGHAFLGYFTSATGGERFFNHLGQPLRDWDGTQDTTLHARWLTAGSSPNSFSVTDSWTTFTISVHGGSGSYSTTISNNGGWSSGPNVEFRQSSTVSTVRTLLSVSNHGASFSAQARRRTNDTRAARNATVTVTDRTYNVSYTFHISIASTWTLCLATGTLITLADGSQVAVENLQGHEELLVWNFYKGAFDTAFVMFTQVSDYELQEIIHLRFCDDSYVKIIEHHGFFNLTLNKIVYLTAGNAEEFVGHYFKRQVLGADGMLTWKSVRLSDVEIYREYNIAWTPVTFSHLSVYANGLLSMPASAHMFLNIFEIKRESLQFCTENYKDLAEEFGLLTYEEFIDTIGLFVPEIIFEGFNVRYLLISVATGNACLDELRVIIKTFEYLWQDL
jgi:hypothetical protein